MAAQEEVARTFCCSRWTSCALRWVS